MTQRDLVRQWVNEHRHDFDTIVDVLLSPRAQQIDLLRAYALEVRDRKQLLLDATPQSTTDLQADIDALPTLI